MRGREPFHFWEYPVSQGTGDWQTEALLDFDGDLPLIELAGDSQHLLIQDREGNCDALLWRRWHDPTCPEHACDLSEYAGQTIRLQPGTFNEQQDRVSVMYAEDITPQAALGT